MSSRLLPSGSLSLALSLSSHPSLHCIIQSFARAISAGTSDFLKLSASLFPPEQQDVRLVGRVRNNSLWCWRMMSGETLAIASPPKKSLFKLQLLPLTIKAFFLCGCYGPTARSLLDVLFLYSVRL